MSVKPLNKKSSAKSEEKPETKKSSAPEYIDIAEIGEIIPDASGKSIIKVRVVEIAKNGTKTRVLDIRKHIKNPDKTKYSGPTQQGFGLPFDQVKELAEILADFDPSEYKSEKKASKKK